MSLPSDSTEWTTPTGEYEAGFWKPVKHAALALALTVLGLLLASVPALSTNLGWIVLAVLYCTLPGLCLAVVGVFLCWDAVRSIGTIVMVLRDGLTVKRLWSSQF